MSVSDNNDKVSVITMLHGEKEFIPLIKHNYNNFVNNKDLEIFIIDDGIENLIHEFNDLTNCTYLHLNKDEIDDFITKIIDKYDQPDTQYLKYQKKSKTLPPGFKRDYGCGMSSSESKYIFHMNSDCIYHKKTIERKLKFLKKTSSECIYCDTMLCYDIYNKELYKTESDHKIYESTLFHTRDFWKRKGFEWSDTQNEGKQFHYNNGLDRKMDNYYDTIQVLSVHNINLYRPIKIELENIDIKIPEIIDDIKIERHPFEKIIENIYDKEIKILGIESDFLDNIENDKWEKINIKEKWKQTKLSKTVKERGGEKYNILFYGSKQPAWELFNKITFDIIVLETSKNYEQMNSIITTSKKQKYFIINGIYLNENFLNN